VLRVDELHKLGGVPCKELDPKGGCGVHPTRPRICREYECLWLQGRLTEGDRPDRLGAVLDLLSEGGTARLAIREARPGAFDQSPRLAEVAESFRSSVVVRVSGSDDVLDPDAPYRMLLPGGETHRVEGEWTTITWADGRSERRRLPWLERSLRRFLLALRRWRLRRY
jgi:hypothetical protein